MRPRFQVEPRDGHPGMDFIVMGIAVVFWAAVIFGLVMLINRYARHQSNVHDLLAQDPVDVAKLRYAKGEITKAEFEALKKDLK